MKISDALTLRDLQREFHRLFPGLKLEFYTDAHDMGKGSSMNTHLNPALSIAAARTKHHEGDLEINADMTVNDLEQQFRKIYGLNAQVFRKSGNLWIQTTVTDTWTLDTQNKKSSHSEQHFNEKYNPL